jgi:hypothetical protein
MKHPQDDGTITILTVAVALAFGGVLLIIACILFGYGG